MAIVIKEMQVNTVIEKKIIQRTDIADSVYQTLKTEIISEVLQQQQVLEPGTSKRRNER